MATVKAILYKSKKLSTGEYPIMLRISSGDERKYISLGFSCSENMWDEKASLPKRKHDHFYDIQALVQKKKEELTGELYKLKFDDKQVDLSSLAKKARRGGRGKVMLLEYFIEVSDNFKVEGRIGYSVIFKSVHNSVKKFLGEKDILICNVTTKLLEEYEAWLIANDVSLVTRSVYFRTFRTLYKTAVGDGLVSEEKYPFKKFAFSKYNDPETQPRSIPKEEIKKIFDLKLREGSKAFHSLNYFKFSYYAYGMNFVDLAKLKWKQIDNGTMEYFRTKTKKRLTIAILPQAQEILDYYQRTYHSEFGFVFPILPHDFEDPLKLYNKITEKRVDFNEGLKQLQKKAGVKLKITSYVARHSFAYNCYTNGVEKKVIGESLGHRYESMTNKYIGQLDKIYISESISKALSNSI